MKSPENIRLQKNVDMRKYSRKVRDETIKAYGGRCVCCNETIIEFLTLDHTNGNGRVHREEIGGDKNGKQFYRKLRQLGFPQDMGLRVMCFNCNSGRERNEGVCPHEATQ